MGGTGRPTLSSNRWGFRIDETATNIMEEWKKLDISYEKTIVTAGLRSALRGVIPMSIVTRICSMIPTLRPWGNP